MLSYFSRFLTYLNAFLYGAIGIYLYFFFNQAAPVFAWKVTSFTVMTLGGWSLGNAWLAYFSARRWNWGRVYSTLIYLWLFGLSQSVVLILFRDKLTLNHPIAWFYVITLAINTLTAIVGIMDWLHLRPQWNIEDKRMQPLHHTFALMFTLFAGFLGVYGLMAQIGWPGTNGGIFPEIMSLFTLRSFGAFYFSLSLSALPFLWEKNLETVLHHGFAAFGLIIFVVFAAFANIRLFDFANRPGGIAYIGVYLIVGVPLFLAFRKLGVGNG